MKPEMIILSSETGGNITENEPLTEYIPMGSTSSRIIRAAKRGTPLLKVGEGEPRVMLTAGIHGNELPPQLAALKLANELENMEIHGTVYLIPFAVPHSTMKNSRRFRGFDMNRSASKGGSASNDILMAVKTFKIDSVADFHATKLRSNPGVESVFCSRNPCPESRDIAEHITHETKSKLLLHEHAGTLYSGALEDECNLMGTPAVTCEVVSENCQVNPGSPERSYRQMLSYLRYFKIIEL
ncbi:succinylglutamate desuccinylase/aspartoacylase family protein [Methanobacterium congolense]|uniref:Succinylglutamate desuccinylase/aspartoacylase n=1 Tax=Methanobacterium congolense TaxID=118062 RepID=A0A1D3L4U5_9EURY|nr:succinylglutamate desuccinylase/aspartoacylase family protein [Methanobacterium congolense]SCG86662.1 Succinylglutamate desuccinylase/aspartoacylase [Methanobacterium congolense]